MGTRFTGDSKDPEVNVTAWCLLVVVVLAAFARLGTKYHIFKRWTSDDFLVIVSAVCSIRVFGVWLLIKTGLLHCAGGDFVAGGRCGLWNTQEGCF